MMNIPQQWARVAWAKFRTLVANALSTNLLSGEGVLVPFTTSVGTFQTIFPGTAAAPGLTVPRYVSIKTTADVCVVFSDGTAAPVAITDALLQPGDSWQDLMVPIGCKGFQLIGVAGSGNFYCVLTST
jgi:hypothetical protein